MLRNDTGPAPHRSRAARWARLGGAALIGASLALAAGGLAAAEKATTADDQTATVSGSAGKQIWLTDADDKVSPASAAPLSITYQDTTETAYCIDLQHPVDKKKDAYASTTWDDSGVNNLSKIKWVLLHSYPTVTAQTVAKAAGVTEPSGVSDQALKQLVYAGTQAAIWHFSDGVTLAPEKSVSPEDEYDVIRGVYTYLVGQADSAPSASNPAPTLTITPSTASGAVGSKVGPYTVVSGGGDTTLKATGGTIVDQHGKAVTTLSNGGQFWVTSDDAGTVTVNASGSGEVPIGRVFVHTTKPDDKQKIILAGAAGMPLAATATATFSNEDQPTLPVTGKSVTAVVTTGLVLLLGGSLTLMVIRRRRVRFTA
ncbi:MAG: Cys-Gln thioester bond-forming surface protein [Dactylosporangium sp.]|nr:thioester domain-containing protein [Dactylosporangium sp.]NNJ60442.1 Cys-Gln thioester bond-forming surface protein [Dactylosporangium sp.]